MSSRCRTRWAGARARAHRHCCIIAHDVPLSPRHRARWVRVRARARSKERRYRLVVVVIVSSLSLSLSSLSLSSRCRRCVVARGGCEGAVSLSCRRTRRAVVVASSREVGKGKGKGKGKGVSLLLSLLSLSSCHRVASSRHIMGEGEGASSSSCRRTR